MYRTILDYIRRNRLFAPGDRVIVALSGGADSVCLLVVLNELKEALGLELKAVHVHHGLRGKEADRDRDYAGELAKKLGVAFSCVQVDAALYAQEQGMSVEEAGRHLRYQIFEKERKDFSGTKIAVAHHKDDQAETILYNLFRGTGLKDLGECVPSGTGLSDRCCALEERKFLHIWRKKGYLIVRTPPMPRQIM